VVLRMTMRRFVSWCLFGSALESSYAALVPDMIIIKAAADTMDAQRPVALCGS